MKKRYSIAVDNLTPGAKNIDAEVSRLSRKLSHIDDYVMLERLTTPLSRLVELARGEERPASFAARQEIATYLRPVKRRSAKEAKISIAIADAIIRHYPDAIEFSVVEPFTVRKIPESEFSEEYRTRLGHLMVDTFGSHDLDGGRALTMFRTLTEDPELSSKLKVVDNQINANPLISMLCHMSETVSMEVVAGKALLYASTNVPIEVSTHPVPTLRMVNEEPAVLSGLLADGRTSVGGKIMQDYGAIIKNNFILSPASNNQASMEAAREVYKTVAGLGYCGTATFS